MGRFIKGDIVRRVRASNWPDQYGNVGESFEVISCGFADLDLKGKDGARDITSADPDCFELQYRDSVLMEPKDADIFLDLMEKYVKAISDPHTPSQDKMEARQELQSFLSEGG